MEGRWQPAAEERTAAGYFWHQLRLHACCAAAGRAVIAPHWRRTAPSPIDASSACSAPAPASLRVYEASGHDPESLLFAFLDELLFVFSTDMFVASRLTVAALDRQEWSVRAVGCVDGQPAAAYTCSWRGSSTSCSRPAC